MKALRLHSRSDLETLQLDEVPTPIPGPGEVLVRVCAAAVTPTELLWATTWTTQDHQSRPLPIVLGHEFSGEVAALGDGVTIVQIGEAVYGMNDWFRDGAQAEYCLATPSEIAPKPKSIDHSHAAVTPISALTAWQGLFEHGRLETGQRVLIHGAAGAVGNFAVQLARWRGARVTATAGEYNLDFVRSLGADQVIDYRAEPFEKLGREFDLVFDTVGGDTLERSWGVIKPTGRVITVAASEEDSRDERVRRAFFIVIPKRTDLTEIATLIDRGEIRPIVGEEFQLADALQAFVHKPMRGKTVLRINDLELSGAEEKIGQDAVAASDGAAARAHAAPS